jgi:hypothetical protein
MAIRTVFLIMIGPALNYPFKPVVRHDATPTGHNSHKKKGSECLRTPCLLLLLIW